MNSIEDWLHARLEKLIDKLVHNEKLKGILKKLFLHYKLELYWNILESRKLISFPLTNHCSPKLLWLLFFSLSLSLSQKTHRLVNVTQNSAKEFLLFGKKQQHSRNRLSSFVSVSFSRRSYKSFKIEILQTSHIFHFQLFLRMCLIHTEPVLAMASYLFLACFFFFLEKTSFLVCFISNIVLPFYAIVVYICL